MILNKPPYLPVHPSHGHFLDSLGNFVMWYYEKQGLKFTFRPVTRLDKNTSGLVIIAKNAYSHEILSRQSMESHMKKIYVGITKGLISCSNGIIDAPIRRSDHSVLRREVRADGARAVTYFEVTQRTKDFTVLA